MYHHRTTTTPLNAALRAPVSCVGPAWTRNTALAQLLAAQPAQRLAIEAAAAATEEAQDRISAELADIIIAQG